MTPGMTQQEALVQLDLQVGASMNDVKRAYRSRIRSTHPDLATDDEDRQRRERDSSLINVALKTLADFGTGSATTSGQGADSSPRTPRSSASSTRMPQGASENPKRTDAGEKASSEAVSKPQTPSERPDQVSEPDGPEKPVNAPETPTVAFLGLQLLHAILSLNYWYGLSLAMRATPFVLLGAVLRALGFWTSPFTSDAYAELTPTSGVWTIAFGSLAVIVLIGAIGQSRLATFTLVVAAVVYGSFVELLAQLTWYQHACLAGLIVVLPAVLILWQPISIGVAWVLSGTRRK